MTDNDIGRMRAQEQAAQALQRVVNDLRCAATVVADLLEAANEPDALLYTTLVEGWPSQLPLHRAAYGHVHAALQGLDTYNQFMGHAMLTAPDNRDDDDEPSPAG